MPEVVVTYFNVLSWYLPGASDENHGEHKSGWSCPVRGSEQPPNWRLYGVTLLLHTYIHTYILIYIHTYIREALCVIKHCFMNTCRGCETRASHFINVTKCVGDTRTENLRRACQDRWEMPYAFSDCGILNTESKNEIITFLKPHGIFPCGNECARETKVAEEYCWAITSVGAVLLWPICFQCDGLWISTVCLVYT